MSSVVPFQGVSTGDATKLNTPETFSPYTETYKNTAYLLDVDDCIIGSTLRNLEPWKQKVLWDLHDLTNGAVVLVTNSDMRGIDGMMAREVNGENQYFPCVSEHATIYRLERDGEARHYGHQIETQEIVDFLQAPFDMSGIQTTLSADALHGDDPILKVEAKQSSVALVFGKHACLANAVASHLCFARTAFDLEDSYEVYTGKDAVELRPFGAKKVNALEGIMSHPNFKGRRPVVYGDSGPDAELMDAAFKLYDGQGRPVGSGIQSANYIGKRFEDIDHLWRHLTAIRDTFVMQKRLCVAPQQNNQPKPR